MSCNRCGEKMPNCDCTDAERHMYAEIEEVSEKIEQLRLTDAEREAIEWAVSVAEYCQHPAEDTLRGLLERTK